MSATLDPDEVRARSFATSRRGYERDEVAAFQEEVAAQIAALRAEIDETQARLSQLGITELPDLKQEFDSIGEDVRDILQAARDAAEDIRDRARADAELRIADAQQQAEQLRGDAWSAAETMLRQVRTAADAMAAQADEDVLFVRAEAEREALRLTGDAKRDAEELVRSARVEADKLVNDARAAAESMVETSQQSADLAQERVRALEQRREELMAELEQTRGTLTELEDKIEGRQAQLTHAVTDPAETSVRVLTDNNAPVKPDIGDWLDEDATVRLVPPPPEIAMEPVDADELVAEVESLRNMPADAPSPDAELVTGGSGSSAEEASLDFEVTTAGGTTMAEAVPDEPAAAADGVSAPAIDDLFARLRQPEQPAAVSLETASPDRAIEAGTPPEPVSPEPVESDAVPARAPAPEPAAEIPAVPPRRLETSSAAWDLRDRMLMPLTNERLRGIKREIVDVQNAVLEELRTEPEGWRPKRAMFEAVLGPAADSLAGDCYRAGITAAGELTGLSPPDLPDKPTHSLASMVTDLWEDAVDALTATAEATNRERGASVGRVFRAWRTDEAERRVRQLAHAEYNAGVAAGLAALGVAYNIEPSGRDIADPEATVIPAA